jgi:hypothetical protein
MLFFVVIFAPLFYFYFLEVVKRKKIILIALFFFLNHQHAHKKQTRNEVFLNALFSCVSVSCVVVFDERFFCLFLTKN